jgi:D-proline reductase (dithiol) PrdB
VGLIQRAIEDAGVPTICITLMPWVTEKVKVPRAVSLEFPLGHPLGKSFDQEQQKMILLETLRVLESIKEPGVIIELLYKWKEGTAMRGG